jgi:hypothetical protein
MIGSVHSSDYSYAPLVRGGGSETTSRKLQTNDDNTLPASNAPNKNNPEPGKDQMASETTISSKVKTQLTEADLAMVRELKQRDQKVRQHEMAHLMASGGLAQGGPRYTYQKGPDGQNYAVGGRVHLDISPGKTPEETLQKAQTIQAAAMAPADPSGQDRSIAAKASQMAMKARMELTQQQTAEQSNSSELDNDSPANRLAQRFFSAVTPQSEPFIQLAA